MCSHIFGFLRAVFPKKIGMHYLKFSLFNLTTSNFFQIIARRKNCHTSAVFAQPERALVLALPEPSQVLALPEPAQVLALPEPETLVLALPEPAQVLALPEPLPAIANPTNFPLWYSSREEQSSKSVTLVMDLN